jgi:pSer/pThr/pTyr-binding forkhead associated (FHA) protein
MSIVVAPAAAEAPEATTLERVSAAVQPAVAYEKISFSTRIYDGYNKGWIADGKRFEQTYSCTGFFVSPNGHVATAGHCVVWDDEVTAGFLDAAARWAYENGYYKAKPPLATIRRFANDDYELRERDRVIKVSFGPAASARPSPQTLPARLLGSRAFDKGDVALVKVEKQGVPALELAPESDVAVGTEVTSVGFPASVDAVTDADSFNPSFKDGTVSSLKTIGGGLVNVYEISSAVSGGMSGGPTVDDEGRVIGVNSFGIRGEPQAFNFVAPAALVTELMQDKGVENAIGETHSAYRKGLDAYFSGDRDGALDAFGQVLDANPSHDLALKYKALATALPEDSSIFSPWLLALVGGIGAVVAAVVVQRRRQRPTTASAAPPVAAQASTPVARPAEPSTPARASAARPGGATKVVGPVLVVLTDDGAPGRSHDVSSEAVIGRENADVLLDDPEVSRAHAKVRIANGRVELTDLGSSNGTKVNDTRIDGPRVLEHGDVIGVGRTRLRVELPLSLRDTAARDATVVRDGNRS